MCVVWREVFQYIKVKDAVSSGAGSLPEIDQPTLNESIKKKNAQHRDLIGREIVKPYWLF